MKRRRFGLVLIIGLAAVLRLVGLGSNPPSLYWEEAALGYDAYSLWRTGKDYHGNSFPLVAFPSFGDYKPSLYFYVAAPFVGTLGLSEMAVRLPSALAGLLTVWLIYVISRRLQFSENVSLLTALLLAISPWHIQFSRAAFEVNLATMVFLVGLNFFLFGLQRPSRLVLASIFWVLSMYGYHSFRIIVPLMGLALVLWYRKVISRWWLVISAAIFLVLVLPILLAWRQPLVQQRFAETSFLSESRAVVVTNRLREVNGNSWWSRIIYHRYWWWLGEILSNYAKHFSVNFLFLTGDENWRHGTKEFGLLYHWELLTILAALYYGVLKKEKGLVPVFLWLAVVPMPIAITKATPHGLRFLPAAPALAIISAYGLTRVLNWLLHHKLGLVRFGLWAVMGFEAVVYWHFYTAHYPRLAAVHWQYGYKEAVAYTEAVKEKYQTIVFTRAYGRPSIYLMFYGKYDPAKVQLVEEKLPKDQLELLSLDKYQFIVPAKVTGRTLWVVVPQELPAGVLPVHRVYFLDGKEAFVMYETV